MPAPPLTTTTTTTGSTRRQGDERAPYQDPARARQATREQSLCGLQAERWASWNLGVFVCIRCSGIHRSMGTHISKVKSVDLDMWTPEQMASVQKWGNRRANVYWEAHLKQGHVPPDHKIESFIRSKYESRRWAMEGPPPADPSVLDGQGAQQEAELPSVPPASPPAPTVSRTIAQPAPASPMRQTQQPVQSQSQSRTLLSSSHVAASRSPPAPAPARPAQPAEPKVDDGLFSLDFHAPPTATAPPAQQKDVKNDIMSLFAKAPSAPSGILAGGAAGSSAFGAFASAPVQQQPVQQSMWGAPAPVAPNVWGAPQAAPVAAPASASGGFGADIWGSPSSGAQTQAGGSLFDAPFASQQPKKDDAFGDLWSSFK
ncbi:ArfGap-domain-containing protein [Exidia glandulosa HHB12029]|uniref:ArfGap-domain-containing protein n=1 Tax=Exidia glandulosa HHB12029 TaxID=1314781 RepID=A0A165FIX0_EXIGL|nr:ArfGap-domain-containing protein [Exidia glandulosa HHB12029]